MLLELLHLSRHASIILSLSIILFAAFSLTRITKLLKLPNVTGYILAGVLIGPYVLKIIPASMVEGMDFATDVALAFIAFGVGRYLKLSELRKNGTQAFVITAFEAFTAAIVVTLVMLFVFRLPLSFALLLGAIGSATAPASTIMTIRQYHAQSNFVHILLEVVALDDVAALLAFSVCAAVAQGLSTGSLDPKVVVLPIFLNIGAILLGLLGGFLLPKLVGGKRSEDNRLILTVATVLLITGCCTAFDISPLLACMALGTVYANRTDSPVVFDQINSFTPPIMALFFVLSGMRLDLSVMKTAGLIGVAYFFVRIVGKYLGAWMGAKLSHAPVEVEKFLGLALIPQAGVSIGLALLAQRILPLDMGNVLSTIILSSSVLYEMIGPACAKGALFLSHSIPLDGTIQPHAGKPAADDTLPQALPNLSLVEAEMAAMSPYEADLAAEAFVAPVVAHHADVLQPAGR